MTALEPTTDDRLIWDTWLSVYRLPVLTAADEIGLFAAISGTARSTGALAGMLAVDARALQILLGALAAMGLVARYDGDWLATASARTWLHPDGEGYNGPALHNFRTSQPLHAQLLATLRADPAANDHETAAAEWERGEMSAELARFVTAYMNAHSQAASRAVAMLPEFASITQLLDVAGGSASYSIGIARAWPSLRSTVMEIEAVAREAQQYISRAAIAERVGTTNANMFIDDWPAGFDAHFMSNIFHDWSEDTCRLLARKSFAALPSGGRIMLHEMLLDDDGCGPLPTALFSVLMLLGTRGRQYSFVELKAMLGSAGFVDVRACLTPQGNYSLVTATKP